MITSHQQPTFLVHGKVYHIKFVIVVLFMVLHFIVLHLYCYY
jgi:hypothetical protein